MDASDADCGHEIGTALAFVEWAWCWAVAMFGVNNGLRRCSTTPDSDIEFVLVVMVVITHFGEAIFQPSKLGFLFFFIPVGARLRFLF